MKKYVLLLSMTLGIGLSPSCQSPVKEKKPYNVLFIAIDDLRPELNCYGAKHIISPNLDRLASQGRLFNNHFVQVPTCGASRHALLTGKRPITEAHLSNQALRTLLPKTESADAYETFAHVFRRNGYRTVSLGKIGHYVDGKIYEYNGEGEGEWEMPFSWDEQWGPIGKWGTAWNSFFAYSDGSNRNMKRGHYPAFEFEGEKDTDLPDGLTAEKAIEKLNELKDAPFFLGVGFFKPHLPFTAPKKYWDMYDSVEIALSPNPESPLEINESSLHGSGEMFGNYAHEEKGGKGVRISDEYAEKLRRSYFAAVSYADAQVGKVLNELERLGLAENTIVVVWGDHGWHLGDQTIWGKHTTFDRALKSTMMIRTPEMAYPGEATDAIVETVDLYPTLLDYADLEGPKDLDGTSLRPLLENPELPGKGYALSYWRQRISLRVPDFRLTTYMNDFEPKHELFDHRNDPLETVNVVGDFPEIWREFSPRLDEEVAGWGSK